MPTRPRWRRHALELERSLNAVTDRAYLLAGADLARATPLRPGDPDAPPAEPGTRLKAIAPA